MCADSVCGQGTSEQALMLSVYSCEVESITDRKLSGFCFVNLSGELQKPVTYLEGFVFQIQLRFIQYSDNSFDSTAAWFKEEPLL